MPFFSISQDLDVNFRKENNMVKEALIKYSADVFDET